MFCNLKFQNRDGMEVDINPLLPALANQNCPPAVVNAILGHPQFPLFETFENSVVERHESGSGSGKDDESDAEPLGSNPCFYIDPKRHPLLLPLLAIKGSSRGPDVEKILAVLQSIKDLTSSVKWGRDIVNQPWYLVLGSTRLVMELDELICIKLPRFDSGTVTSTWPICLRDSEHEDTSFLSLPMVAIAKLCCLRVTQELTKLALETEQISNVRDSILRNDSSSKLNRLRWATSRDSAR